MDEQKEAGLDPAAVERINKVINVISAQRNSYADQLAVMSVDLESLKAQLSDVQVRLVVAQKQLDDLKPKE